jgi:hypothetical protein
VRLFCAQHGRVAGEVVDSRFDGLEFHSPPWGVKKGARRPLMNYTTSFFVLAETWTALAEFRARGCVRCSPNDIDTADSWMGVRVSAATLEPSVEAAQHVRKPVFLLLHAEPIKERGHRADEARSFGAGTPQSRG